MIKKIILEFDSDFISIGRAADILDESAQYANRNNDPEWHWLLLEMMNGQSYQLWRERISENIENIMIVSENQDWPDRMKKAYKAHLK